MVQGIVQCPGGNNRTGKLLPPPRLIGEKKESCVEDILERIVTFNQSDPQVTYTKGAELYPPTDPL